MSKIQSSICFNSRELIPSEQLILKHGDIAYVAVKCPLRSNIKRLNSSENFNDYPLKILTFILILPADLTNLGCDILKEIINKVLFCYEFSFYHLIKSEINKLEIIKTPILIREIKKGDTIKKFILELIFEVISQFSSNIIDLIDSNRLMEHQALSYFSLKSPGISHIICHKNNNDSSISTKIKYNNRSEESRSHELRDKIFKVKILKVDNEFEIVIKNIGKSEIRNIRVKLIHIEGFIENEKINELIEIWPSQEELLFTSPIILRTNEFLLLSIEESVQNTNFLSRVIDINLLNSISNDFILN